MDFTRQYHEAPRLDGRLEGFLRLTRCSTSTGGRACMRPKPVALYKGRVLRDLR